MQRRTLTQWIDVITGARRSKLRLIDGLLTEAGLNEIPDLLHGFLLGLAIADSDLTTRVELAVALAGLSSKLIEQHDDLTRAERRLLQDMLIQLRREWQSTTTTIKRGQPDSHKK